MGDSTLELLLHRIGVLEEDMSEIKKTNTTMDKELTRVDESNKVAHKRIGDIEKVISAISELSSDLKIYTLNLNSLVTTTENNTKAIFDLQAKPGKVALKYISHLATVALTGAAAALWFGIIYLSKNPQL